MLLACAAFPANPIIPRYLGQTRRRRRLFTSRACMTPQASCGAVRPRSESLNPRQVLIFYMALRLKINGAKKNFDWIDSCRQHDI
jgi:hypothetical protein